MSSQTLPESPPVKRPLETAPSQLAADEPSWVRTLGLAGMMLTVLGLTVVAFNEIYGQRIISRSAGLVFVALGVLAMLFHAIRDPEFQIRRAYGTIGFALIAASGVLPLIKPTIFLSYGWACSLGGLCFLLALSRHETDPAWRKRIVATLGCVGIAMSASGILGGIIVEGFMLTYGSLLSILGLFYLCAFSNQHDVSSEAGYKTGRAIGAAAVFVVLYAFLRSVVPGLIKMDLAPFFVPTGLLLMVVGSVFAAVALGIASDNRFVVLTRRELGSYFYSPIAYLVMMGMALFGFGVYYFFFGSLQGKTILEPIVFYYFQGFAPIVILLIVPAITMRLLAEEKRTGTYEVLMCAPVKEWTVVLSKHAAAVIFFVLLWSLWTLYLIALRVESGIEFDYRPLLSFFLALTMCGSSFISMGLFFSSMTKNQIVGAVLTFMGLFVVTVLSWGFVQQSESVGPLWKTVFRHLSYTELLNASLKGQLPIHEMVLQGSFTFFWLFLTVKVLEARKWS